MSYRADSWTFRYGKRDSVYVREEEYYIGCGTGKFMFWKSYDTDSEIIIDLEDLLLKVKLDGKLINEIWKLIEIILFSKIREYSTINVLSS